MYIFIAFAGCIGSAIIVFVVQRAVKKKTEVKRGWRVRVSSKYVDYEECFGDVWLMVSLEHVPYDHGRYCVVVPSAQNWKLFPYWAKTRRTEIIDRIKSDRPHLDYVDEDVEGDNEDQSKRTARL